MNFCEWVSNYYNVHKRLELKENTIRSYMHVLKHVPTDWVYENVTVLQIQALINDLAAAGLATSTVKHVFTVIRKPLIDGIFYGLPDKRSEVVGVTLPRAIPKDIGALKSADAAAILSAPADMRIDAVKLLLLTGLRFGELAAINSCDINLSGGFVTISKSYYRGKLTEPKTRSSVRRVPLSPRALSIVRRYISFGKTPLFVGRTGNRLDYRSCLDAFHRLCGKLGIKRCGLHALRHTFATELFRNGENLKVVSGILGHASVAITADIYTDLPFELCRKAVQEIYSIAI